MTPQVISLSAAGSTAWIPVDYKQNPFNIDVAVVLSNTPNLTYKVEYTLDDIFNPAITPTAFSHSTLVGLTANGQAPITYNVRAIRLTITAWTSGTATMTALQGAVNPVIYKEVGSPLWISGIPFIIFPGDGGANGLIFNGSGSGAFTLSAAVITNYVPNNFYTYLPADSAYSGSIEGWYYGKMASTTTGTIYNNIYDPTTETPPTVPTTLNTLPVTVLTRLSQTTAEITIVQKTTSPMSLNGVIRGLVKVIAPNTAGLKIFYVRVNNTIMYQFTWASSSTVAEGEYTIQNTGSFTEQLVTRSGTWLGQGGFTSMSSNEVKTVDISSSLVIKYSILIAVNTEAIIFYPKLITITN